MRLPQKNGQKIQRQLPDLGSPTPSEYVSCAGSEQGENYFPFPDVIDGKQLSASIFALHRRSTELK